MKPPVQSFDLQPMCRVRLRGTQNQTVAVIQWLLVQMQKAPHGKFTGYVSGSGPSGGDNARQCFVHFYIANELVEELRTFLVSIGLQEEA